MSKANIAVDFDGVLASWTEGTFYVPGPPIPGSRDFIESLSKIGNVIIYTCRTNSELYGGEQIPILSAIISDWLIKWGMDKLVHEIYVGQGKPFAAAYIDDKAVPCDPEELGEEEFNRALEVVRCMCRNGKQHPQKNATKTALQAAGDTA